MMLRPLGSMRAIEPSPMSTISGAPASMLGFEAPAAALFEQPSAALWGPSTAAAQNSPRLQCWVRNRQRPLWGKQMQACFQCSSVKLQSASTGIA